MYRTVLGAMVGLGVGLALHSAWASVLLCLGLGLIGWRLDDLSAPIDVDLNEDAYLGVDPAPEDEADAARRTLEDQVASLFVALVSLDGNLLPRQVRLLKHFFAHDLGYAERDLVRVRDALKSRLERPLPVEEAAAHCVEALGETERLLLFDSLVDVALVNGDISADERALLERLAALLQLDPRDVANVFVVNEGDGLEKSYRTLGVKPEATDDEVKRAWRRLAALHHPDKVAHLGASAVAAAEVRFREARAAWEAVQKARAA